MSKGPFEKYNTKPDYFLKGESEPESLERIDARIQGMRRGNPKVPLLRWFMIGAAAIFLAFLVNDVFFQPTEGTMAAKYFEPMPNYVTSVQRGTVQQEKELYANYDKGNYAEFIAGLKDAGEANAVDSFYLAVSYCGLEQWQEADRVLSQLQGSIPQEYRPAYGWYRSLALLGMDRVEDATVELESVARGRSVYAGEAAELLDALR